MQLAEAATILDAAIRAGESPVTEKLARFLEALERVIAALQRALD